MRSKNYYFRGRYVWRYSKIADEADNRNRDAVLSKNIKIAELEAIERLKIIALLKICIYDNLVV